MFLWCALEKKKHQETFSKFMIVKQISCLFTPPLFFRNTSCHPIELTVHPNQETVVELGDSLHIGDFPVQEMTNLQLERINQ